MNRKQRRASAANGKRLMTKGWSAWERVPLPDLNTYPGLANVFAIHKNNMYIVQVVLESTDWGLLNRFMVRRNDGEPIRSWSDMQRIKNELAGPERVAVEVYPPQCALVDSANIYHLWILPENFDLPLRLSKYSHVQLVNS